MTIAKRLTLLALAITAAGIIVNQGCGKSSSSDSSSPAAAAATTTLTLALSSPTVIAGGSVTVTASGGNGTYMNPTASTGSIYVSAGNTYTYMAPTTATAGTPVTITISDSAGTMGYAYLTIGSSSVLTLTPLASTVAPSSQTTFVVTGGTAPYYWQVLSGGGSMNTNTGTSVVYTAPATAATASIYVYDSAGHNTTTTVTISGTSTTATCGGTYNANVGGPAYLSLVQDSSGNLSGYIIFSSNPTYFAVRGLCTSSGLSFTMLDDGTYFVAGLYASATTGKSALIGTYTYVSSGATYTNSWSASPY